MIRIASLKEILRCPISGMYSREPHFVSRRLTKLADRATHICLTIFLRDAEVWVGLWFDIAAVFQAGICVSLHFLDGQGPECA